MAPDLTRAPTRDFIAVRDERFTFALSHWARRLQWHEPRCPPRLRAYNSELPLFTPFHVSRSPLSRSVAWVHGHRTDHARARDWREHHLVQRRQCTASAHAPLSSTRGVVAAVAHVCPER